MSLGINGYVAMWQYRIVITFNLGAQFFTTKHFMTVDPGSPSTVHGFKPKMLPTLQLNLTKQ